MLDVLLLPIGSYGDVYPFVGLGLGLRARGHRVRMAANGVYRGLAERHGFEFHETTTTSWFEDVTKHPHLYRPGVESIRTVARLVLGEMEVQHRIVEGWVEGGGSVIVASPMAWAARIAQDRVGIPVVTSILCPALFFSVHRTPRMSGLPLPAWMPSVVKRGVWNLVGRLIDSVMLEPINALRAAWVQATRPEK